MASCRHRWRLKVLNVEMDVFSSFWWVLGVASHWRMLQISTYQIKMVYEKTPKVRKVQHFVWNQQYSHAKPGSDGGGWGGGLVVVWCGAALILEKWLVWHWCWDRWISAARSKVAQYGIKSFWWCYILKIELKHTGQSNGKTLTLKLFNFFL